jgi:hypothetical protein
MMDEEFEDEIDRDLLENGPGEPPFIRLAKAEQRIRELMAMNGPINQTNIELRSKVAELESALAEAREDAARLQKAREILFAYTDNEITADPWWAVVRKGSFGCVVVLEGPFFSRERAEALRTARLYEYGAKSYVFCFSGHRSQHYKALRAAIGAPVLAAIDATRGKP